MKIPIKFRGRDVTTGTVIYGNFVYDAVGKPFIVLYKSKREFELAHVDPDSVAQLVGYDVDGKEVYEDDTLTDILGNEYTAKTRIELTCDDAQSCTGKAYYAGTVDNLQLVSKPKEE